MSIKLVVFDLDGTLLDTSEGIISAVNHTIKRNGLKELGEKELKSFIGPPIQNSFRKAYEMNDKEVQKLAEQFRERYKNQDLLKAKPYEGIYFLMDDLVDNGYKIAVATYKREDYALDILRHFGFDKYAIAMHGADNLNDLKKKDIIRMCIKEIGISRYNTVYIGDTKSDMDAAFEAGTEFIGVNYGFGFKNVKGFADKPMDITDIVRSL